MTSILQFHQAIQRPDLVSSSITNLLIHWHGSVSIQDILVAEIDPKFANGNSFCEKYEIPISEGANCVVVEAVRGESRILSACVVPVNSRIDFNGKVRKLLNARRVSLAPLEEVLQKTQMEYGSVTPFGLPANWPILIDSRLITLPRLIIGAGLVKAKLSLPGKALAELNGAQIIDDLGLPL